MSLDGLLLLAAQACANLAPFALEEFLALCTVSRHLQAAEPAAALPPPLFSTLRLSHAQIHPIAIPPSPDNERAGELAAQRSWVQACMRCRPLLSANPGPTGAPDAGGEPAETLAVRRRGAEEVPGREQGRPQEGGGQAAQLGGSWEAPASWRNTCAAQDCLPTPFNPHPPGQPWPPQCLAEVQAFQRACSKPKQADGGSASGNQ